MSTPDPFELLAGLEFTDDTEPHTDAGYVAYLIDRYGPANPLTHQHIWTSYGPTSAVQPSPECPLGPLYVRWRACITCGERDVQMSAVAPQIPPCGPTDGARPGSVAATLGPCACGCIWSADSPRCVCTGVHGTGQATTEPTSGGAVEEHPEP